MIDKIEWLSVDDELPKLRSELTSDDVLFACDDGEVYYGYYHLNECFYGPRIAASTRAVLAIYGEKASPLMALFWAHVPRCSLVDGVLMERGK